MLPSPSLHTVALPHWHKPESVGFCVNSGAALKCFFPLFLLAIVGCTSGGDDLSLQAGPGPLPDQVGAATDSPEAQSGTEDVAGSANAGNSYIGSSTVNEVPSGEFVTPVGPVFVFDEDQTPAYTFAGDADGVSNCLGTCVDTWPPLLAASEYTGDNTLFSTIERDDRSLQWAYKNRPLYAYSGEGAAGEVSGNAVDSQWYVARPDPFRIFESAGDFGVVLVGNGSMNAGINDPAVRRDDFDGYALYIYTLDTPGVSNCNAGCAEDWPPLYADEGSQGTNGYSVITRSGGTKQWAYNGSPLYFYVADGMPGEITGDAVGGVWFVATP